VSPAVPSSSNGSDVEIDLGRWAHRVLSRWYIVLACVIVAIVIAMLGEGKGHQEWTARALVNQGLPYTSTNQPILQSLGTNTSAAATLLKQDIVVKFVAAKVGLKPGQLKGAISTQPVGAVNAKTASTPLVGVIVRGAWKTKVAPAANLLGQQLVKLTGTYQVQRLKAVQLQVKLEDAQLDDLARRNTDAINNYKAIQSATGMTQVEKALALGSASGVLNTIGTRQSQLQEQRTQDVQTVAQIEKIEMPSVITRATATQTTAASKRAGYAVAILLGLIVGVLLALLSYAAWPAGGRDAVA
jgi:hypothetical protein